MNRKLEKYKKEILNDEDLTKNQLNRLIKEKVSLPGISGEKMALLAILQDLGTENNEIIEEIREELIPPASLKKIGELSVGMRCASLVAKISRILPQRQGKNRKYQTLILLDRTGQIPLTFFGNIPSQVKEKELRVGDPVLIKCVNVKRLGKDLSLVAGDGTRIQKVEEKLDLKKDLPPLKPVLSIKELLDELTPIEVDETKEVNCRGTLVWKGEPREFEREDGSVGKVMHLRITGRESNESIRGVVWGRGVDLVANLELGDLIQIRGGKGKVSSYHLDQGAKKREALELHIGNLTSIKREGRANLKINQAEENMRGKLFYLYALESPRVRNYEKNGERKKMLFLKVGDATGVARLVVWNEHLIDKLKDIERRTRLKSFGNVKSGEVYDIEIHVSNTGNVKKAPSDFPNELNWEDVVKSREEQKKSSPQKHIGLITDFSKLEENVRCDLEGILSYKEVEDLKRGRGVLILGDGRNRIKGTVWNNEILKKIGKIPEGSRIRVKNVATPKKSERHDLDRVSIEDESSLELIEKSIDEKGEVPPKVGKEEDRHLSPLLLHEIQEEGPTEILVTIDKIKEVGMKDFCEVCGGMIVSSRGKKKICERGHETNGQSLLSVILRIEDGKDCGSAIIKGNKLHELHLSELEKSEILSNRNKFTQKITEKLVGNDFLIEGEIRFVGGESRIYITDLQSISPSSLTDKILKKISNIQSRKS